MNLARSLRILRTLAAAALLALAAAPVFAADTEKSAGKGESSDLTPPPRPEAVSALEVHPAKITLRGGDATQQLVVTGQAGGRAHDLTGDATYEVADAKVARVLPGGRLVPLASGQTDVTVRYGSKQARAALAAEAIEENLPISFANQIVPVFTKLGCNSGGCHGKASGQNGFKLSLLGFEPDVDHAALVKEARGRRVLPASPDNSLLMLKAAGGMAHAGGKRLEPGSDDYKLLRRWLAAGLPFGKADDPVVTGIHIYPEGRTLARHSRQQIAAYATYSDGTVEDITRRAQYESNDTEVASVDGNGLVRTLALSGEAAIMARYQGHVAVFRATVPLGTPATATVFRPKTVVDGPAQAKWQQLGIAPSEGCTDEVFLRRARLDLTGTLPTPAEVKAFLADRDPAKRDRLIDRLLETPEYAYYFANKWADILRVKRGGQQGRAQGTFLFHDWIRQAVASDKPYDEFAREILAAVGDEARCPPTVWYKDFQSADQFVDNASQVFLGLRIQCAQCHHHPYEKWGQDDYWGLAAFYGRVATKNVRTPGQQDDGQGSRGRVLYTKDTGSVTNKRTGQAAVIKPLDGEAVEVSAGEDPRQILADWMTDPKNPFFAKAVANRYWAHFFGRGIVDPLDDMRVTNPPSNPELLDALAKELVEHKYSLKHLAKVITKSATYGLSSTPNETNKTDKQAYSRYYPKRLSAEVLFDAVAQVTDSPTTFNGVPQDRFAPRRAIMLPDESFTSYFLDVFGRPQRLSACECERVNEANLAQALHLLNSEEVQGKIARSGGRADALARDKRPEAEKVEELFLWALGRKPGEKQLQMALANIEANAKNKKLAYENILWALLNTKEFVFNR